MRKVDQPSHPPGRTLRDPFADRASLLCRTLLSQPGSEWSVRGLAQAAGVTPMLSSDVVRQLEAAGIVNVQAAGRRLSIRLVDPWGLLQQWTAVYRWTRNQALPFSVPVPDAERMIERVQRAAGKRRWALTLLAGAWQRIRYAPTERLHAYVECDDIDDLRELAARQGWPEDAAGQLVLMKPAYRASVWHETSAAVPSMAHIVSDLQLVLDLWHYPDRGRETAEQLWRRLMRGFERTAHA